MRWWRIKRRMSLDWMVNWSLIVIVWSMCVCVLGVGVCEALDLEVAVESFESVQECKGVNCSISIEFFKSGQQTASMPLIFRLEVLKYK